VRPGFEEDMGTKHGFTKVKKYAQGKSDASGWNQHVNKLQKRVANKVVRRMLKEETVSG
jgi:hypothetical protein